MLFGDCDSFSRPFNALINRFCSWGLRAGEANVVPSVLQRFLPAHTMEKRGLRAPHAGRGLRAPHAAGQVGSELDVVGVVDSLADAKYRVR